MTDDDLIRRGDALRAVQGNGAAKWTDIRDAIAALPARGVGVEADVRDYAINVSEAYDTMIEVERNPAGAWQAIQALAGHIDALPARGVGADAVLDAAHAYLVQQYGHSALAHPIDRARILAALETRGKPNE